MHAAHRPWPTADMPPSACRCATAVCNTACGMPKIMWHACQPGRHPRTSLTPPAVSPTAAAGSRPHGHCVAAAVASAPRRRLQTATTHVATTCEARVISGRWAGCSPSDVMLSSAAERPGRMHVRKRVPRILRPILRAASVCDASGCDGVARSVVPSSATARPGARTTA